MTSRKFLTAGHAIFTVQPSQKSIDAAAAKGIELHPHYTYLIERADMPASGRYPAKTCYFVKSLTGPDNTADYVYLGMLDEATGTVKLTTKSAFPETATRVQVIRRVCAAIWQDRGDEVTAAGWGVNHCGYCGRCGKLLTVPESVACGYGPECVKNVLGCTLSKWSTEHPDEVEAAANAAAVT